MAAQVGREGAARITLDGCGHTRPRGHPRRLAARGGVPGDDRQDSSVLPFLEAGPHGDLGQLAHAALRERYGPEVPEADAAHDDRRRLWPRILRERWQGR